MLHDPSARQDLKSLRAIGALYDLKRPLANLAQPPLQLLATVAAVSKDMSQPRVAVADGFEDEGSAVPILDVSAMDDEPNEQTQGISEDMPLTSFDLSANAVCRFFPAAKPRMPPLSVVFTL